MKSLTYNRIIADLEANKKDFKSIKTSVLKLIIGELQRLPDKDPDEKIVQSTVKKILNNSEETLRNILNEPLLMPIIEAQYRTEIEVLKSYLPQQMTDEELYAEIYESKIACGYDIGFTMKSLANAYPGQYDGRKASEIFRSIKA